MKRFGVLALALLLVVPCAGNWPYPPSKAGDTVDTYFGKVYKDPYRWLEDLKSPEVDAWFKAQADLTDGVLAKIPAAEALAKEWMELDKLQSARYTAITWENGRVFYKKTLGGENVGKAYYRQGWNGAEKLLFDPTGYKKGVTTTIESLVPSVDGHFVAMGFSAKGAEFSEIRVLDVDRGVLLPESFYPSYAPYGWTMDSTSLFYDAGNTTDTKSLDIELNRKTKLHKLGTDFSADRDFFSNATNPELGIEPKEFPMASIDESYPDYVIGQAGTVQNELRMFYAPVSGLKSGKAKWSVLCKPSDDLVRGMAFHKDHVYAVTHAGAPRYKLVRTSVKRPDWARAETVLPEAKDSIQSIVKSKDYLFVVYSNGILGRLVRYEFATGKTADVPLPVSGSLDVLCPDFRTNRCIVTIASWTSPVSRWDLDGEKSTFAKSIFNSDVVYPGFDTLVADEVEVPGDDGTPIPLSIIHKKGLPLDGSASCILTGYGAYGISLDPWFDLKRSVALRGVVIAVAHVRGGGEKGEAWYKAGYKTTKPNTWKDFISCAEYLVKKGYTSPGRLAGTGTSAGGILISRAITTRPDLFAAAVCNVGCANAMRMEFSPNGPVNTPEFGTVKDRAECEALYEMDGVQHVQPGVKYPAVLCVAGWNDPRVTPWEPGKFAAALQSASASGKPVLLKVNYDNGHFTEEKIVTFRNFAAQTAFLLWQTGHKDFQPSP
jgi:prolyl oligopeptidase